MIARLEAWPLVVRLGLAWLLCLLPRIAAVALLGAMGDYWVFAAPDTLKVTYWYPAYEALAGGLWALSGGIVRAHIILHLAIHAALGPLVYATCRRLQLSPTTAWLAVIGVAGLPYYVSTAALQPQVGVTLAFVAAVVWLFALWADTRWQRTAGAAFAVLAALSLLLRPNLLVSIAALYGLAAARERVRSGTPGARAGRSRIAASGALWVLALLTIVGVSRVATGHWSPLPPTAGHNFYVGHNERTGEYLRRYDVKSVEDAVRDHGYPPEIEAITEPFERDAALLRSGLDFALSHPQETLVNTALKLGRYWDPRLEDADRTRLTWNLAYTAPYVVYGGLALWGAFGLLRRGARWPLAVIGLVLASYWLPHVVLFPTIRMRMTTEFLLVVLAADAIASLLARVARDRLQ